MLQSASKNEAHCYSWAANARATAALKSVKTKKRKSPATLVSDEYGLTDGRQ